MDLMFFLFASDCLNSNIDLFFKPFTISYNTYERSEENRNKNVEIHTLPQCYHLFIKPEDQCQILKPETENSVVLTTEGGVKKVGLNPFLSSLGNITERIFFFFFVVGGGFHILLQHPVFHPPYIHVRFFKNTCICHLPLLCANNDLISSWLWNWDLSSKYICLYVFSGSNLLPRVNFSTILRKR